jgi:hypothetical protein
MAKTDKAKAARALKQATTYLAIASAMLAGRPRLEECANKLLSGAALLAEEVERGKA